MYRSVCFHISYNKKYIWISIIVKRQNFMVTPHVHREWRYHWARDNVIDIYMVPIVYYVGFDQWTCTWAGVQKPRGWLTHRYSRQNLAYSHSLNQIHITRLPNWSRKRQYRKCTVWIAQLAAVYLLTTYPTITDVFQGFFLECMVMIENNKFQELSQSSHSNRPITSPLLIYTKSMKSCQIWATTACFLRYGFKKKGGEKRIPDSVKEVKYFVYQPCIASCSLRFACWNIAASPLSTKPCVILSLRITVYRRILFFWRRTISKSYYFVLIRVS